MTEQLQFVDSHAHLNDDQFTNDVETVIGRSTRAGVTNIVNVAFTQRLWRQAVELSQRHSGVSYTVGVHPNNADEWNEDVRSAMLDFLATHSPVAIGETGLDSYWDRVPRAEQLAAFADHLDIAAEFGLPVIIHMRGDVEEDIRSALGHRREVMCIFHSFDGSAELCDWIIERGWMIGVGGLMSRRSAKSPRACLSRAPLDQLLLETDSPYLAPTGWTSKRNTPESIPIIAIHLVGLLDVTLLEISRRTTANAIRVLGLPIAPGIVRDSAEFQTASDS